MDAPVISKAGQLGLVACSSFIKAYELEAEKLVGEIQLS
jgi:hypothetical protein